MYIYTNMDTNKRGKLFIPRKLDERLKIWNESQPIIDGERINQYDLETGEFTGRWGQGEIDGGNTIDLFKIHYDIFFSGNLEQEDFEHLSKVENRGEGVKYLTDIIKADLIETLDENGPLGRAHFDLTISLNDKRIRDVFDSLVDKEISDYYKKLNESEEEMGNKDRILKSFEVKKELNHKIWDDEDTLKPKIKSTLLAIGQEFYKTLDIDVPIDDIIFTGSLANYNWSEYSDVDLHVVIDFNEFDDKDLIKKYFDAKKVIWNDNHNIKIKGYDVELYAQDKNEEHESSGIYSIMNNEWIKKPNPKQVNIDRETIKKKVKEFEKEYNRIFSLFEKGEYQETKKSLDKIKDKIKKYRKAGLDKTGEMGTENLVFKTLRRSGLMEKIINLGIETTDKEYTIETFNESEKKKLFIPRKLSKDDSRYDEWNKSQPIKDGVRINQYDYEGRKQGYWEHYFYNGGLYSKGNYVNNNKDGYWERYYESGQLDSKGSYVNGKWDGYWEVYFPNGILRMKGNFKDDKQDGYWELYYRNGQLESKGNYVEGNEEGYWESYYPNGELYSKGNYVNGKFLKKLTESEKKKLFIPRKLSKSDHRWMDHNKSQPIKDGKRINQYDEDGLKQGYWEYYYENGQLEKKGTYVDGKRNGYWEDYYDNGSLTKKGNYINGEWDGYWEVYFPNGILRMKGNFKDGKEEGYWELYYRNGQLESKGNYVEGNEEGYWEKYYVSGRLNYKGYYKNGEKVKKLTESEEPKNGNFLKDFKKNIGIDVSFLTSFGAGINGLIRNVSSLIKDYTVQPLNNFELINLAIAMIVVYLKKNKSIKDFKDELLSITAFTSLMPGYIDLVNSLVGNVDFMEAFMTLIKSIGVYSMLNHFKSK